MKRKSEKTSEIMEGFSFVISITGFNNHNTEKDHDDYLAFCMSVSSWQMHIITPLSCLIFPPVF
jgi:hypothetical protein